MIPGRVGDRVVVIAEKAPPNRHGAIVIVHTLQGALVRHDEGEWMGPHFGYREFFNWTWAEMEPEAS